MCVKPQTYIVIHTDELYKAYITPRRLIFDTLAQVRDAERRMKFSKQSAARCEQV